MLWLLDSDTFHALQRAERSTGVPTAKQRASFIARNQTASSDARIMQVDRGFAEITVSGVLTKRPDLIAFLFGGGNTTYRDIQSALATARSDPAIKSISLLIDSPGGQVDGLYETAEALRAFPKPRTVRAANAQSAAYVLAAAGGKIEATSPAATFGSVGVAASFFVSDDVVDVTNTDSPHKRPDPTTDEGKAVIREYLDQIHDLIVGAIAKGRGTTTANIRDNFGAGASLLAGEAKKRGMIDSIASASSYAAGDNEAGVARVLGLLADIRTGKLRKREGETDEQFVSRILAMDDDVETDSVDVRSGAHRVELGERVADAVERLVGRGGTAPVVPPSAAHSRGDTGTQVADRVEALLGTAGRRT